MAIREIAFIDSPAFSQVVELEGRVYQFAFRFNGRFGSWFMDIRSGSGDPIAIGIRIVLNYPLLRGINYDDRLPPGEFFALCPTGRARNDPGRDQFLEANCVRLLYFEEADVPV